MTVSTRGFVGYAVVKPRPVVKIRGFAGYAVQGSPPKQIRIDDIRGYALTAPSKSIQINDVFGYALASPAKAIQINDIHAYAIMPPSKAAQIFSINPYALTVPVLPMPLGITGHDALIRVIIATQQVDFDIKDFYLDPPSSIENDVVYNATVKCHAGVTSYLYGSMDFTYYRRALRDCWTGSGNTPLNLVGKTNTLDLLPELNALTGMIITSDDIVSTPIKTGQKAVILTAKSTSWFFQPGTTMKVGDSSLVPLSSLFSSDTINWS